MRIITDLLITALYTIFVQNLVMNSGLGMSEAMRVSTRPGTFLKFALIISGFSTATSVICYFIDSYFSISVFSMKALVYGGFLAVLYILTACIFKFVFKADKELLDTLGIAALNTLVYAVPYINSSAAYSFADCIGSGLGAGLAFVLAAALIGSGTKIISENNHIPDVFKGTPAMFLYVGLISLGFSGFTGSIIF